MSIRLLKITLSENEIQKACIDWLRINHWYVIENYKNKKPRVLGISDITAIKKGRHIWIEFKKEKGVQSKEQIEFEMNLKNHGAPYVVIRSFEELMEYLNETEQGNLFTRKDDI